MKFVTVQHKGHSLAGLHLPKGVLLLAEAAKAAGETADLSSVLAIVRGGPAALDACRRLARRADEGRATLIGHAEVSLLAPLPTLLRNAFCVGRNYVDHVKEGAAARNVDLKLPEAPQYFTKATHTLV